MPHRSLRFSTGIVGWTLVSPLLLAQATGKTNVTSSNLQTGGSVIPVGTITITPSDAGGNPIPFAGGDGSQGLGGFKGNIVNGVIQSVVNGNIQNGLVVPDQALSAALTPGAPLWETIKISNTATGAAYQYSLPPNTVTGSTFALDQYRPIQVAAALSGSVISVAQPVNLNCSAGSRLIIYNGTTITSIYECVNGQLLLSPSGGGPGVAPALSIGTVTQGTAGVSMTPAGSGAYKLNFVIPAGTPGANGTSPTISIGAVTTGPAGSRAAVSVDQTSTSSNTILDFILPQGAAGQASSGSSTTNSVLFADTTTQGAYWSLYSSNGRPNVAAASSGSGSVNSLPLTDSGSGTARTLTVASGRLQLT